MENTDSHLTLFKYGIENTAFRCRIVELRILYTIISILSDANKMESRAEHLCYLWWTLISYFCLFPLILLYLEETATFYNLVLLLISYHVEVEVIRKQKGCQC